MPTHHIKSVSTLLRSGHGGGLSPACGVGPFVLRWRHHAQMDLSLVQREHTGERIQEGLWEYEYIQHWWGFLRNQTFVCLLVYAKLYINKRGLLQHYNKTTSLKNQRKIRTSKRKEWHIETTVIGGEVTRYLDDVVVLYPSMEPGYAIREIDLSMSLSRITGYVHVY